MEENAKKVTGEVAVSDNLFLEIKKNVTSTSLFRFKLEETSNQNTSKVLEVVLAGATVLGSSDIHIEPEKEGAKIRARIDGILQDIINLDQKIYLSLLSRIKLLSGVKLNVTQKSQDGRFSISFPEIMKEKLAVKENSFEYVEIRASILPSEYGETVVLRILNPKSLVELETLGLDEKTKKLLEKEIKKPNGMIIVTGPTGSGKTTTLYAILKKIRRPEIKIVTIEDPIEYHLDNISQTEVHSEKGYDFANGLRAIVRQDPDVILVGEIRDLETAQIGLQAALTGHLVLTTLHTNDAAGAIARLQALGEKPHNIGPAVNIVVAQRLLRKVCSCAKKRKITEEEYKKISRVLGKTLAKNVSRQTEIPQPTGCEKCNHMGYKGRIGIFEFFIIDDEMEKLVLSAPSSAELKEKAVQKGMTTLYQDGLIKVLQNETTLEEVERVAVE